MRILALEPYYRGSHQAFLEGWRDASRHHWTLLTLPGRHWKWRMRHAAPTLAQTVADRLGAGEHWDLVWASDMLDLAAWRGLAPNPAAQLPAVGYFHESQWTYPEPDRRERDHHLAFTNLTTAAAADAVWFNSDYHRRTFLHEAEAFLRRMPDHPPLPLLAQVTDRAEVRPPGIPPPPSPSPREGPTRLLWAARWEHDKRPDLFFEAVFRLAETHPEFRLDIIGETFPDVPPIFAEAHRRLHGRIDAFGHQTHREEYERILQRADIWVSTADHEFFGLAAVEAAAAGVFPLVPRRLAYPEVLDDTAHPECFYDGTVDDLVTRLGALLDAPPSRCPEAAASLRIQAQSYTWEKLAPVYDDALETIATRRRSR